MVTPTLRTRSAGVAEGVLDTIGRAAHQVEDRLGAQSALLEQRLNGAWKQVRNLESALAERARGAARQTDGYVRAHPWQVIAAVSVAGLLLGALLTGAAKKRRTRY